MSHCPQGLETLEKNYVVTYVVIYRSMYFNVYAVCMHVLKSQSQINPDSRHGTSYFHGFINDS